MTKQKSPRYLAFDIETAKITPGRVADPKAHRPLGICCCALWSAGEKEPSVWYGKTEAGEPAAAMTREDLVGLISSLEAEVQQGHTILTWNGLGFDFDILAEESGCWDRCRTLAAHHVDMMFHVYCQKGFPVGLDAAAQGMNFTGKSSGVDQAEVPRLWADGQHQQVLEYVANDCRVTLDIAIACEQAKSFRWLTKRGTRSTMPLRQGWLNVLAARELPQPDTSWMDNPLPRSKFTGWLDSAPDSAAQ